MLAAERERLRGAGKALLVKAQVGRGGRALIPVPENPLHQAHAFLVRDLPRRQEVLHVRIAGAGGSHQDNRQGTACGAPPLPGSSVKARSAVSSGSRTWRQGRSAPRRRNINSSSFRHSTPSPRRSTSIAGEKKLRMVSVVGWNSRAGEISSSRGGSGRSAIPGKYPYSPNSPRSRCHLTRSQ